MEIAKYVLPALVVFATVYFVLKSFLNNQFKMEALKSQQSFRGEMLPVKLQAYERLTLFAERISPNNLAFRLSVKETSGAALAKAMMVSIQQEYQHNLSQQIYVSESLWKIIDTAKDNILNVISMSATAIGPDGTPADLLQEITKVMNNSGTDPIQQVRTAIKKELEYVV